MSTGNHGGPERRKHHRLPILDGLIEPISLKYAPPKVPGRTASARAQGGEPSAAMKSQPAILTNLSAGGMSLITFVEPPHAKTLAMQLSIPGFDHIPIEAKVVRMHMKGETYNIGLQFTDISKKSQKQINEMAVDHMDCETRIALRLPEACTPHCTFHRLCQKPQKAPHWPPKV